MKCSATTTEKQTNLSLLHCVELHFPTQYSRLIVIKKKKRYFMASKLLFLKKRKKPKEGTDELAVVKAAAWAWYQHGSGSEGKAMCEFDVKRTHREPRPSRYKLEAMKMTKEAKEGSPIHTNKSLLDAYEIESISRQLDNLIKLESNHKKLGNGTSNPANASLDNAGRRMKKKMISKGFWLRHGAICGSGEDVVDTSALRDGRSQSARRVPAANLVKFLPMANGAL